MEYSPDDGELSFYEIKALGMDGVLPHIRRPRTSNSKKDIPINKGFF